jgi:peptidoglycan lytic transglycosylase
LPRFGLAQLFWVVLLVCGSMMVGQDRAEAEEALASWYGPGFDGEQTASGEVFDAGGLSTAHETLPMGTELIVSYGGKSVPVTVNDRGPFLGERELDLSRGAAKQLGLIKPGVDYVQVECANGGIYPNCSMLSPTVQTTPQTTPPLQDAATGDPILENAPIVQDVPALPDAPIVQEDTVSGTHVVLPGETLTGIAAQLGTTPDALMVQNGIGDPNLIYPGQPLLY